MSPVRYTCIKKNEAQPSSYKDFSPLVRNGVDARHGVGSLKVFEKHAIATETQGAAGGVVDQTKTAKGVDAPAPDDGRASH